MRYETSIEIDAPLEKVWAVLTDVERWPEWTASVTRVERLDSLSLTSGSRVRLKQPRLPAMVWEVTELQPERSFSWKSTSGGVTSVAGHVLLVAPRGRVTASFSIRQSGALASIVGLFTSDMTRGYVQMEAQGLKRRCEGG